MNSGNDQVTTGVPIAPEPEKMADRSTQRPPMRDTDFKEKYPPDRELGKELDDTARVWKVYRDEAIDHDDALLKTWNDTVNILLTFAGLFSAAVTSFVIASTDDLKPDPNAYIANVLISMFNATGDNPSPFAHFPVPPPLAATPTPLSRVVNGLWFTSLFLALAAAFLCILVKQWLDEYRAHTRRSAKHPHEWAQRRSFYFQGLTDWNVAAIISFLPPILHLALFLFLAGLTAFLWDLDNAIRWVLLCLMSLLLAFYVVVFFLPVWSAACPYATPLLAHIRYLGYAALVCRCRLHKRALLCGALIKRFLRNFAYHMASTPLPVQPRIDFWAHEAALRSIDFRIEYLLESRSCRPFERVLRRFTSMGRPDDFGALLDCNCLGWLMQAVSDSDAVAVAWQALGGLLEERNSPRYNCMVTVLPGHVTNAGGDNMLWRTFGTEGMLDDMQLGRMTRSALFIAFSLGSNLTNILNVPYSDGGYTEITQSRDAALIFAFSRHYGVAQRIVQAIQRFHEQGNLRPLPSTASYLLELSTAEAPSLHSLSEAVVGLLHHCHLDFFMPETTWTHAAQILCRSCSYREAHPSHVCNACCIANFLGERALELIADEQTGRHIAPFDAYFHVQLVVRIVSSLSMVQMCSDLSDAVWTVLTDSRYLSSRIQSELLVPVHRWAWALHSLAIFPDMALYASFLTQYNSTWCRLLSGLSAEHSLPVLESFIRFSASESENALYALTFSSANVFPWDVEIADPHVRPTALRSGLNLAESLTIACCSFDRNAPDWRANIDGFLSRISLPSLFPHNLDLTVGDYGEWMDSFASTVQHLVVLDRRPWTNLRDYAQASTEDNAKNFFRSLHHRLTEMGPCTKGACASKAPDDWLGVLGPTLEGLEI